MVDRSKISGELWVRMLWVPRESSESADPPIVLVNDRRRFWLSGIELLLSFLLAIVMLLIHLPAPAAAVVLLLLVFAGSRYASGGRTGYYELRRDGSLGAFLGKRMPPVLKQMQRVKA